METIKDETWKPIIGFKGYIVSSLGNVISNKRRGNPKKLKGSGIGCMYHLVNDAGEQRYITKKKLIYAFLHEKNSDSINGYIIGPIAELRLVSKEEFHAYSVQKSVDSRAMNEERVQQIYDETLKSILLIRQFYSTGDINPVAEEIHRNKEITVDYIVKYKKCSRRAAYDLWSVLQEELIIGIYKKNFAVLNIRTYLARMARSEVARTEKEAYRTVYYDDCKLYKSI